jgi:hypothetical protein
MNPIASAADYADALLVARAAFRWGVRLLLALLLGQIIIFYVLRHGAWFDAPAPGPALAAPAADAGPATGPATSPTTRPAAAAATHPIPDPAVAAVDVPPAQVEPPRTQFMHYLLGLTTFGAMVVAAVLLADLLLVLNVMLVGRLLGVAPATRALLGLVALAAVLFPWQAFLNNADLTAVDFKIPGVLYTWEELRHHARFPNRPVGPAVLHWFRFLIAPLTAAGLLVYVGRMAARGLALALGEIRPPKA